MAELVNDMSLVLQYPAPSGGFVCCGFSGGNLPAPVFIVVEGAEPADQATAADVGAEIARQTILLPGFTPTPHMPCGGSAPAGGCHALRVADCRKIYVRISATGGAPGTYAGNFWDAAWGSRPDPATWHVIVALPARDAAGGDPWSATTAGFPPGVTWGAWNACRWRASATEVVPAVIASSGLAPAENRVFISYIRRETTALADQLFEALTERGFDVFLDRCSVPVGVRFQERLMQDLDDKAVVVLLHSAEVAKRSSPWVEQEIARIKQYRLGLVVLRIPDATGTAARLRQDLNADLVRDVTPGELEPDGTLVASACHDVIARVCEAHARGLVRRRRELVDALGAELVAAGKAFRMLPGGDIECGSQGIVVGVSPRPPELTDYCGLSLRAGLGGSRTGACLTPAPLVLLERRAAVQWLGGVAAMEHLDQEGIGAFIDRIV